jgi:hypothetical protein
MARVNITRQVKTLTGWKNVSLDRDGPRTNQMGPWGRPVHPRVV